VWFLVMISLGITARNILPEDTIEDFVLLNLVKYIMPASGYSLLLVVLISVVMSSLDSLLNAGAVVFTQDIVKPFVKLSNGSALNIGRAATIAIAIIAAASAVFVPSIIGGLLICYTIWAPAILPILIIGLWIKNPRPLAGILSMVVGTVVAVLFEFHAQIKELSMWIPISEVRIVIAALCDFIDPYSWIPTIIPALASSLLAYFLGHVMGSTKNGA
jgi:SSS family solute:Na+ symporter